MEKFGETTAKSLAEAFDDSYGEWKEALDEYINKIKDRKSDLTDKDAEQLKNKLKDILRNNVDARLKENFKDENPNLMFDAVRESILDMTDSSFEKLIGPHVKEVNKSANEVINMYDTANKVASTIPLAYQVREVARLLWKKEKYYEYAINNACTAANDELQAIGPASHA